MAQADDRRPTTDDQSRANDQRPTANDGSPSDPRHRRGQRHRAEHDRHDRRGTVHHHPADRGRDGRTAGHAGLDSRRGLRHVRRAGVGGTGRGHARVGRIVSLSARDLRAAATGTADFFSLHLAAFFQRAAVDRVGSDRTGRLCVVFLARSRTSIRGPSLGIACSTAGHTCKFAG